MTIETIDHPNVALLAHHGGDESVLQAMLVSTGADLEPCDPTSARDVGRINALMKNRHGTPFEHNHFKFYVHAGIFVFREFQRHRIGWSYNEESGRYKKLAPVFYVPGPDRLLAQADGSKQMEYKLQDVDPELREAFVDELCYLYENAYSSYEGWIERGIVKEMARLVLPVGIYSSMYATCNARSLMSFLSLRTEDELAMFPSKPLIEIQQVSAVMEAAFMEKMPVTYHAWVRNGRVAP